MRKAVYAAVVYSALVFVIGFALGTIRVLLIAPRVGETAAVALETPIMLAVSWFVSLKTMRGFGVPHDIATRTVTALVAFVALLALEIGVSVGLFHRTIAQHFAAYDSPPGLIGLGAQTLFALFPLVQRRRTEQEAA